MQEEADQAAYQERFRSEQHAERVKAGYARAEPEQEKPRLAGGRAGEG